jgi:hypothetical protein
MAIAQTDSTTSRFYNAKNIMIEIDFNPLGDDGIFSFDNLQTKYWLNKRVALRLGLEFDRKSNALKEEDYDTLRNASETFSEKTLLFGIKPGIEFRFLPDSRVSPYWGVELSYINKISNSTYTEFAQSFDFFQNEPTYERVETEISGAWKRTESTTYSGPNGYYSYSSSTPIERAYQSLGLNILFGTDIFILKNLYVGFEIGAQYQFKKLKQITVESEGEEFTFPSERTSDMGFYYNNSIRLGVYF